MNDYFYIVQIPLTLLIFVLMAQLINKILKILF